jgi:hypothetical protein
MMTSARDGTGGRSTEGLTFEKFQATLKKNRDALMQRHSCKRVRFPLTSRMGTPL